jgi:N-succinyldiaminopimelate aminotransferase
MSRNYLRSSLQPFGVTIFSEMTQLANAHNAINLAQGFPDFDGPPMMLAAAAAAMQAGHNQYAPSIGIAALRQAIARQVQAQCGLTYDPDTEVTVTCGATEALWSTSAALLEPGDEAVIVDPCYDSYPVTVTSAGGVPRHVTTEFPSFAIDPDRLAAAGSPRTKLIFVNTPTNPTGKAMSEEQIRLVGRFAREHDAVIVSDEAYEQLLYDGRKHLPVAAVDDLRERTVMVCSASKTFSATGWRIGWILAPAPISDAIRRAHQFVTFTAATPLQHGVAAALDWAATNDYYEQLRAEYTVRRDLLARTLAEAGVEMAEPEGTYFIMTRCLDGFEDDVAYCRWLTTEVGVAAIPCSFFFAGRRNGRDLARFAFCKRIATLEQAAERLRAGLAQR